MKSKIILSLLSFLLVTPLSFAADDPPSDASAAKVPECSLKQADLKGIIKKSSPLIKRHFGAKPDEASASDGVGITESALLANKSKVIYRASGCEHAAVTITYRNVKTKNQTTQAFVELALKMLKETPFETGAREPAIFESALKAVGDSPKNLDKGQIELKCGDANCALDFREKTSLVLSYDMAL